MADTTYKPGSSTMKKIVEDVLLILATRERMQGKDRQPLAPFTPEEPFHSS